jgi:hypothetical protein
MRPYAGIDYNLTLYPLQNRLQLITMGARVDLKPMPESTVSPQSGTLGLASVSKSAFLPETLRIGWPRPERQVVAMHVLADGG